MWARVVETCLGIWLVLSPFVFRHPEEKTWLWMHDLAAGFLLVVLALASYARPLAHAHLLELPLALWLVGFGWWRALGEPTPDTQNHVVLGFLVLMLAIVPSDASRPPEAWREWIARRTGGGG